MNDSQNDFNRFLGEAFKTERERQKLSRLQLSGMANVGRTGIIMFERGERSPTIFICHALASALGVPLSTLIRRAEKAYKESQGG